MFLWKSLAPACARTIEAMVVVPWGVGVNRSGVFRANLGYNGHVHNRFVADGNHPIESGRG